MTALMTTRTTTTFNLGVSYYNRFACRNLGQSPSRSPVSIFVSLCQTEFKLKSVLPEDNITCTDVENIGLASRQLLQISKFSLAAFSQIMTTSTTLGARRPEDVTYPAALNRIGPFCPFLPTQVDASTNQTNTSGRHRAPL
eukprot:SAG11_NODE_1355_length_5124_cov_17.930348_4_plen_141_part_00